MLIILRKRNQSPSRSESAKDEDNPYTSIPCLDLNQCTFVQFLKLCKFVSKNSLIRCCSSVWEIAQENINVRDRFRNCRIDRVLELKREPRLRLTIIVARDRDSKWAVVGILSKYIEVADGRGH